MKTISAPKITESVFKKENLVSISAKKQIKGTVLGGGH
jgi:hypothetical protein